MNQGAQDEHTYRKLSDIGVVQSMELWGGHYCHSQPLTPGYSKVRPLLVTSAQ